MTDVALLCKFATLPAHLQAEVADFIDFLVQKMARNGAAPAPEKSAASPEPPRFEAEALGPLTSSGEPRIPLERGAGKHLIAYIADDFDETPEEFKDYM